MAEKITEIEFQKKVRDFENQLSSQEISIDEKFEIFAQYRNYLEYIDYQKSIDVMDCAIDLAKKNQKIELEYRFKFLKSSSLI